MRISLPGTAAYGLVTMLLWGGANAWAVDLATPPVPPPTISQTQERVRAAEEHDNARELVAALNDEADALLRAHEFDAAEKVRLRVLHLEEDEEGDDSLATSDALWNLGWFYNNIAHYERSREMLDRCLEIRRKRLGSESAPVAEALNALGALEENRSNFAQAEAHYREAISIQEKVCGPQDKATATTWNNLATLYWITGDYAQAEKFFTKALAIREKTLGPNTLAVASTLDHFAQLDSSLGDYEEAEGYFQRALRIRQARLGPDNPFTVTTLSELGLLYVREGNDTKAEPLLVKAVESRRKTYPADHPDVARSLFQLALLYDRRKLYAKAEPLHLEAMGMRLRLLGAEHPEYASSVAALARHYQAQGHLREAEPFYEQALQIDEKVLGKNHPDTQGVAADLAYLKLELGERSDAVRLARQAADAQQSVLNGVFTFAPERQRMNFEKTIQPCDLPAALGDAELLAQVVLRTKGVVLDSLLEDEAVERAAHDPAVRELVEKRRLLSARLLRAEEDVSGGGFALTPAAATDRDKLEEEEKQLEADMAGKIAGSGKTRRALSTSVADVRKAIPKDAALIEYVAYNRYTGRLGYEPAYGAVILTHDSPPRWLALGSTEEIGAKIHLYQKYMRKRVREAALSEVLRGLHQSLCQPVIAALPAGIHRLIISPDGELNFVSFATLLDADSRFFGDDFDLHYVSSGRDLLQKRDVPPLRKQMIVFANPDYDRAPNASGKTSLRGRSNASDDDLFEPLPGTEREALFLQQEAKRQGLAIEVYRAGDASKANLAKLNSPYVLHLATHGLYLSTDEVPNLAARTSDGTGAVLAEPMWRSLLALSGASATLRQWKQGIFPPSEDDGLLSAQEVANLNLDRTWLVVLSACDTGSGEACAGEGVLGLRRGFVEAGAQNLLMTLWPVDDTATVSLMEAFYRDALRDGDAPGALIRAQRATLAEVRQKSGLSEAVRRGGPFILSY